MGVDDGWVWALEHLTFLDDAPHLAWATGEMGAYGCLMNVDAMRTELCAWFGLFVWGTAFEPDAGRLWVARPLHHRVDLRDARSGALLGSVAVDGTPRPITIDPQSGLGFVGMYFSGNVAIIDLKTLVGLGLAPAR